jgi:hypothetical protein
MARIQMKTHTGKKSNFVPPLSKMRAVRGSTVSLVLQKLAHYCTGA